MTPRAPYRLARLACALVILALLSVGILWLVLRGSLPQYEGTVQTDALSAPVAVERDTLGTTTLHAQNRHDLVWALGYVHAQERFFEMDLLRRQPAGELAELFGSRVLPADREARKHRMRARASSMLKELPVEQRELLDAYRDGVNEGLDALTTNSFPYLLLGLQPLAWRSEDSLLVIGAMYFTLKEASDVRELAFSTLRDALPPAAFRFLSAKGGKWDAPLLGPSLAWPDIPSANELDLRKLDPGLMPPVDTHSPDEYIDDVLGSNSFAVTGSLAGGAALVANDMHLELRVPNIWFRTRFIYPHPQRPGETSDITGASLPGTPAITVGSNRHIAWGFTNSYGDLIDWVRITRDPDDPLRYRTADGWKRIEVHREVLRVRGSADETLEVQETEWGPIAATDHDGIPLAFAWTAHQPGSMDIKLTDLEQAESVDQAIVIVRNAGIPAQNFIVGDRTGRTAWTIAGRLPARDKGYDPRLPADWGAPGTGWNGWLDPALYPTIIDPTDQRLWTANARTVDGLMLERLGDGGFDLGARAKQIRDTLYQHDHFTPATMLAIQLDDRALFLARWRQLLEQTLERTEAAPWRTEMQQALKDWDERASTKSVAYRVVRAFRQEVVSGVLRGFEAAVREKYPEFVLPPLNQEEHAVWKLIEERPLHLLLPVHSDWDDLLGKCAHRVAERFRRQPGGIAARTWGERNTANIRHPFSQALPLFIGKWLDMPKDELAGDSKMPRVQGPAFGASNRLAVAPGDEENGYFEMPGGQSGHPLSPYYGSGHEGWVTGRRTPFLPGPPEQTLHLLPAHKNPS
ncbi:penicillin amidase [Nitrosospira multiformis]|uniref:Penicillin amidase n=1 Tax=Nitrosospira multiformis TaxID=1231 RepID=A0A2T5ID00_9PROT|nr:penicillin acylase family protein [Nitrosospira multiformis]PTQ81651.1 penicillin amidase [Nitrosospira multiformis]